MTDAARVLLVEDDTDALGRICNVPKRFLGRAFMRDVEQRSGDLVEAIRDLLLSLRCRAAFTF